MIGRAPRKAIRCPQFDPFGSVLTEDQWQALEELAAKGDQRGGWRLGDVYVGRYFSGDLYVPAYPIGPRGGVRKREAFTVRIDPDGGVHPYAEEWPLRSFDRGTALRLAASGLGSGGGAINPELDARLEAIWRTCKR
jgi:hypothetical protein